MVIILIPYKDSILASIVSGFRFEHSIRCPGAAKHRKAKGREHAALCSTSSRFPLAAATLESLSMVLKSNSDRDAMLVISFEIDRPWNSPLDTTTSTTTSIDFFVFVVVVVVFREMGSNRFWTCRCGRQSRVRSVCWIGGTFATVVLWFVLFSAMSWFASELSGNVFHRIEIRIGFHVVEVVVPRERLFRDPDHVVVCFFFFFLYIPYKLVGMEVFVVRATFEMVSIVLFSIIPTQRLQKRSFLRLLASLCPRVWLTKETVFLWDFTMVGIVLHSTAYACRFNGKFLGILVFRHSLRDVVTHVGAPGATRKMYGEKFNSKNNPAWVYFGTPYHILSVESV